MSEKLLTVIIPTYNRGYCINIPLDSLINQTCQDFECIVIDDGSSDNTKEIIDVYKFKTLFNISYYYKENGGVHTAINLGVKNTKTQFFLLLGSDDSLELNAVEILINTWNNLSNKEKKIYSEGVVCLVRDTVTNSIIGGKFPKNINRLSKRKYVKWRSKGERIEMRNIEAYLEFPIPEQQGLNFVMEGTSWIGMNTKFRSFAVNKVIRKYCTDSHDSLSNSKLTKQVCKNMHYSYEYIINKYYPSKIQPIIKHCIAYILVVYFGLLYGEKYIEIIRKIKRPFNKILCVCFTPFSLLYSIIKPINN